jgi:hypothetical protein
MHPLIATGGKKYDWTMYFQVCTYRYRVCIYIVYIGYKLCMYNTYYVYIILVCVYNWSIPKQKKKVAVVTAGVVVFNFGAPVKKGHGGGSDSTYGLALIAFSLFLDGLTGGLQDRVKETTVKINPDKKNSGNEFASSICLL